jgi:hypothetical protein
VGDSGNNSISDNKPSRSNRHMESVSYTRLRLEDLWFGSRHIGAR